MLLPKTPETITKPLSVIVVACLTNDRERNQMFELTKRHPCRFSLMDIHEKEEKQDAEMEWPSYVTCHTWVLDPSELHIRHFNGKVCLEEVRAIAMNRLFDSLRMDSTHDTLDCIVILDSASPSLSHLMHQGLAFLDAHPNADFYDSRIYLGGSFKDIPSSSNGLHQPSTDLSSVRICTSDSDFLWGPEVLGDVYAMQDLDTCKWKVLVEHIKDGKHAAVTSGFLGMAVCDASLILKNQCHCSALPNAEMDHSYRMRCDEIVILTTYTFHGGAIGMFLFEDKDIFYMNTYGYNYPVVHHLAPWMFALSYTYMDTTHPCKIEFVSELCIL